MSTARSAPADGLDQTKLHFVDAGGLRTRYYMDGTGEPLALFSGGSFGSYYSLDAWSLNLPVLARDFTVYGVDKPGQGQTDPPETIEEYTIDRAVQHAYDFSRAVAISQGCYVGHSRGALLMTRFALDHSEFVRKLIIVDSDSIAPELPMFPNRIFYNGLHVPEDPFSREAVRIEADAQAWWKEQVTDDFVERMYQNAQRPKFQEGLLRRSTGPGQTIEVNSADRLRRDALRRIDEGELQMPVLIIWGLNDRSAPYPKGQRLFERIAMTNPHTEMHVLNVAGHYSFRDQYEAFNRTLRNFCLR